MSVINPPPLHLAVAAVLIAGAHAFDTCGEQKNIYSAHGCCAGTRSALLNTPRVCSAGSADVLYGNKGGRFPMITYSDRAILAGTPQTVNATALTPIEDNPTSVIEVQLNADGTYGTVPLSECRWNSSAWIGQGARGNICSKKRDCRRPHRSPVVKVNLTGLSLTNRP